MMEMSHISVRIPLTLRQRVLVEASTQTMEKRERVTETDIVREGLILGLQILSDRRKEKLL